jgi:serine/threonine protein kinase
LAGFTGTERFTILECLGAGGFGEVFAAFDAERGDKVALKVPNEAKAKSLYLFKQEFRALADVSHPNLVCLHELVADGTDWFFTMELVEGKNFHQQLRPEGHRGREAGAALDGLWAERPLGSPAGGANPYDPDDITRPAPTESRSGEPSGGGSAGFGLGSPPRDYREVRDLTRQLAEGLGALHQAGKLHRDIKPTNVLVTREGRVVLVDFGLAVDLAAGPGRRPDAGRLMGTPSYMAPEQILGQAPSEASDWFSVGVMLYRALTGQLPFPGLDVDTILGRMSGNPQAPAALVPGTPADLSELCMDLLCRSPQGRPPGREVLRRLGGALPSGGHAPAGAASVAGGPAAGPSSPVGRGQELWLLDHAFKASRQGGAVVAMVRGASGMGKSFLLRHFLRELQLGQPDAVVLGGRCFEQESVPYKALDQLMDAITQHLLALPAAELGGLLPADLGYLARLFPVLRQVESPEPAGSPAECPDPREFRRRAFAALRGLLRALGERHPLVLAVDDLQWGDRDSLAFLESLLRPPDAPAMLLVLAYRPEDGALARELRGFRENLAGGRVDVREIGIGELAGPAARELAQALLGPGFDEPLAAWIAREAGGNPYFIAELARQAQAEQGSPQGPERLAAIQTRGLEPFILSRVEQLPEADRRILEVLAVARQPVHWDVLARACGPDQPRPEHLNQLRAAQLIRAKGPARNLVETFHDRIRETVARTLPALRAQDLHWRLARSMEEAPKADPRALAFHFQEAGERIKAAGYAEQAAEQATLAMAFEQAARLYRQALDCRGPQVEGRVELLARLGDALANAGLGAEAAQAYQDAAGVSLGHEAIRFQRKTAEQYFRCGHFDQGLAVLRAVLATLDLRVAASPWRALVSSLWRRALIRARGLRSRPRPDPAIPAEALERIDICWAGAMGLGPIDHIRGGDFQARQLALSLRAGEPHRLVRALAHETVYVAHRGSRSRAATERILATTLALAERVGAPGPLSRAYIAAGTAALMQGRWKAGMELHEKAEALLREHCTGMDYELHIAQNHGLVCQWVLGDLKGVAARLSSYLQAAREKADLLMTTNLRTSVAPHLHLAQDDPGRARMEVRLAMARWSPEGFHIQHYHALVAQANIHLYEGRPELAWEEVSGRWSALRNSLLLRVQTFLITMLDLRARAALALAQALPPGSRERRAFLRSARADRRRLRGERTPYGDALALKLQAQEALAEGRRAEAAALCLQGEIAFEACDMVLHALALRHVRSRLEAPGGTEFLAQVEARLRNQGVANPARFVAMHVPSAPG